MRALFRPAGLTLLGLILPGAAQNPQAAFTPQAARNPQAAFTPQAALTPQAAHATALTDPIVFVSRAIPDRGSIYWSVPGDLPGVGPHSRFRVAAPGRLIVREPGGTLRTLVDGSQPTPASLELIDVNAPDVSWDGTRIVFAGLPAGAYDPGPTNNPGAWRLYVINSDGTGLTRLTSAEPSRNLGQFGAAAGGLGAYDDTDPCWLPDGRVVFSSTRWPSYGHYSGVRTTNLHVINADGSGQHRITSERNGADRPRIDPLTGKIVYARWWRNHRFAWYDDSAVPDPNGGWIKKDGLSADRGDQLGGGDYLWRNAWQLAAINPDGTGLALWSAFAREEEVNHAYGGAFTAAGDFIANYFPMYNMTEAAGFGGLRRFTRGPGRYAGLIGITYLTLDYAHPVGPTSYGVFNGSYAAEPEALPDGRVLLSHAPDVAQDYGLYLMNDDGTGLTPLLDLPGTTELRARVLSGRPLPPVLLDTVAHVAGPLPPTAAGPYDTEGTFVFEDLNVYFNAPVDADIVSAPPVGSAQSIRFFIDHQRTSPGSFPNLDWPIRLAEIPVLPDGSLRHENAPADVPLFEQLRGGGGVPLTGGPYPDGAAHVAGLNFGRPGTTARCVGCHAGHTLIPLPATAEEARWTNVAPGATLTVSSQRDANYTGGLIDRQVMKGAIWRYWNSAPGRTNGEWAELAFPVPLTVRRVRLYNPRFGDAANSTLQVQGATVRLLDAGGAVLAYASAGPLAVAGTDLAFADVPGVFRVRVTVDNISGTFYGIQLASLAEVEVIARAGASSTVDAGGEPPVAALALAAHPNPFQGATTLNYRLPKDGAVRLDLFDAGGRRVARLVDRFETAGPHEVPWQDAAPAGLYFYRLSQGGTTLTGKLVRLH